MKYTSVEIYYVKLLSIYILNTLEQYKGYKSLKQFLVAFIDIKVSKNYEYNQINLESTFADLQKKKNRNPISYICPPEKWFEHRPFCIRNRRIYMATETIYGVLINKDNITSTWTKLKLIATPSKDRKNIENWNGLWL